LVHRVINVAQRIHLVVADPQLCCKGLHTLLAFDSLRKRFEALTDQ
jgi:hypothetical protein